MILMSTYFLGEVPFKNVYLHGLVRDEQGRKMSKSLDNIIDPLDIIPKYGADALRLALVLGSTPGNDIKLGMEKIASSRNFTNKLWNIGRYILTQSEASNAASELITPADHWIRLQLDQVIAMVTAHLESYNFSMAGEILRDFTWNDFADWYVEIHKIERNDTLLRSVFETILKLWHPFMPFVSEALFQSMHDGEGRLLMVEPWPVTTDTVGKLEQKVIFEHTREIVTQIRNVRAVYHIEPAKKIAISILSSDHLPAENQQALIRRLARVETIILKENGEVPENSAHLAVGDVKVCVHLEGIVDITKELARLTKEKENLETYATRTEERLGNPTFVKRAPEQVIVQTKEELAATRQKIAHLKETLGQLQGK